MIKISRAQATQATVNGTNQEWIVTLDGEELYKLPSDFSVEDTFRVRDIVETMMARAAAEMREQEQQLALVKIQAVVSRGDAQLDALKRENERLADVLQQHI